MSKKEEKVEKEEFEVHQEEKIQRIQKEKEKIAEELLEESLSLNNNNKLLSVNERRKQTKQSLGDSKEYKNKEGKLNKNLKKFKNKIRNENSENCSFLSK